MLGSLGALSGAGMGETQQEMPTWTWSCVWDFPACCWDSLQFASGSMAEHAILVVFSIFWDGQGGPPELGQCRMLLLGEVPEPALSSRRCFFQPSPARRWLQQLMTPNMCWLTTRSSLRKQQPLRREVIACCSGAAVTSLECALRCLSFKWNPSIRVLRCFLGKTSSSSHRTSSGGIRHPASSLQSWDYLSPSLALSCPGAGTRVCLSVLSRSRWRHSLAGGIGAAPELLQPHTYQLEG